MRRMGYQVPRSTPPATGPLTRTRCRGWTTPTEADHLCSAVSEATPRQTRSDWDWRRGCLGGAGASSTCCKQDRKYRATRASYSRRVRYLGESISKPFDCPAMDDPTLQRTALKQAGCKRIYEEKVSGATRDRLALTRMLDQLRRATSSWSPGSTGSRAQRATCWRSRRS